MLVLLSSYLGRAKAPLAPWFRRPCKSKLGMDHYHKQHLGSVIATLFAHITQAPLW